MNDCYHSLFNRRKESSLEELYLPSLSYRYAALKVRGCDPGDRVLRGLPGDIHRTGSCPPFELKFVSLRTYLPRKEVIQPHLPVRLPCYDFTPLTLHTFGASPLVRLGRRLRVQTTRVV